MRGRSFTALPQLWRVLRPRACEMRNAQTKAERVMWEALRSRRFFGLKFRRQHPVGPYIVNILCPERPLGVEVDGLIHNSRLDRDATRDEELAALGLRIFRCSNDEVLTDLESVLGRLAAFADAEQ